MAEDIGPRYTVELLDIISGAGNEQKEQGRVFVVPRASGQIDFIGPGGASLNTDIISMISLCLALSAHTVHYSTKADHNDPNSLSSVESKLFTWNV